MAEVILQAKHLGISFGGLKAVDDFNIEIKAVKKHNRYNGKCNQCKLPVNG